MDTHFFEEHGIVRREGESVKAFRAFRAYLQMPPERRSIRRLESEGYALSSLFRWSAQHGWQLRARAFDASVARAGLDALLGMRPALVVSSLQRSIENSLAIQEELSKWIKGASPVRLRELGENLMKIDAWQAQILGVLAAVEEQQDGAESD